MKQTAKTAKQSPITDKNRHEWIRLFLLSQPESDWLRLILVGYAIYPHLLLMTIHNGRIPLRTVFSPAYQLLAGK